MKKINKKGFTLIEMLVVIAIIAILVAIIIPTVSNATEKAKQATDLANIRSYVAQWQIENLNGVAKTDSDAYKALQNFKDNEQKSAKATYTFAADTGVVKYQSTLLTDGNDPDDTNKKTYKWTLGDLVTETTAAAGKS